MSKKRYRYAAKIYKADSKYKKFELWQSFFMVDLPVDEVTSYTFNKIFNHLVYPLISLDSENTLNSSLYRFCLKDMDTGIKFTYDFSINCSIPDIPA